MISKKEHIVSIIKIVVFIVIFVIMCFTLNYLCKPYLTGDTAIINGFYGEKKDSLDVVYVGGSASFVYYQPLKAYEDYGITSYNFGANTIQAELYKYMIEEVLNHQDPKLIIIDARAFQYRDKDQPPTEVAYRNVLSGTPLNLNKVNFIEKYVKEVLNEKDTLSYYFDFIKFHSAEDTYPIEEGIDMMLGNYKHPFKGFMFIPKVAKQKFVDYKTNEEKAMNDDTVEILDELLDYLKEKELNVLFIVSPYIEQKKHKEVFNYVERRVTEAGFYFIDANDYRDEMNIDYDYDFYNYGHVNIFGSDKYTNFLTKFIKENVSLEDHRNDPEYKSWNDLLVSWNNQKQETILLTEKEKELIS